MFQFCSNFVPNVPNVSIVPNVSNARSVVGAYSSLQGGERGKKGGKRGKRKGGREKEKNVYGGNFKELVVFPHC